MKKIVKKVALALIAAGCGMGTAHAIDIKVMTYNVRNGVGLDNRRDHSRTARVIDAVRPDVVAVQEVDSVTGRSGGLYVLGEIAAQTAMYPIFAPAIEHDGGLYGIGLLCRERPDSVTRVVLPGREEARALLIADYPDYSVACTHLSLTEADALASVPLICREAEARAPRPMILMGDLNSLPSSAVIDSLRSRFTIFSASDTPTYPADSPEECIDYIMVANCPDAYASSLAVVNEPAASDHRPIRATLTLPTAADRLMWHSPYLQNVGPDGATVMFQTTRPCTTTVEFGTDTTSLRRSRQLIAGQEVVHDLEHKVRLDSLTPGATYYYRVRAREILANHAYSKKFGRENVTPFYQFTAPAADATDFTVLVLNDLHNHRPVIADMAALAASIPHDLIVFNGDCLSEPPSRTAAVNELHHLANAFNLAENPSLFIRGNHEIRNAYSSGMPSLFDRPGGKTYGAFTLGDIRFVTLDCGEDKPDDTWVYYGLNDFTALRGEQLDFLRSELRSKPYRKAARRVLIHHIPVWGNTDEYRPCTALWSDELTRHGRFDVNIVGHTHEYRHLPKGTEGNPWPVIVGGGPQPDSATMIVIEKRGKSLTVRVLDHKGNEIDSFEL